MSMNRIFSNLSIIAALVLSAANPLPAETTERDFGFGNMEIYKFEKGTRLLKTEDIDHDGLSDILFLNNAKSRLEILFRKAGTTNAVQGSLLDEVYDNKGMMLDQQVSMYRLVDINHDGLTDVLTMGTPLGLFLRVQKPEREFSAPKHIFLNKLDTVMTIQTGDLNEDGLDDIIVSRRNSADILWNDKDHSFLKRKNIPYTNDKSYWLELVDADADGHLDLLQYYNSNEIPLQVRRGNGKGEFGMAHMLRAPRMRSISLIRPRHGDPLMLSCILKTGLGMRLYGFHQVSQPQLLKSQEFTPRTLAVPDKDSISHLPWITCDFNHDGYDDLLVSAPTLSQLYLYHGCSEGLVPSPLKCDTLSKVNGLALLANGDVLVVSKKEKTAAIHHRKTLTEFPEMLPLKGELVSATAITGTKSIYVVRRSDDKMFLDYYQGLELKKSWPLELDNDPPAMRAFTLDKGRVGVLLFIEYSAPEMLLVGKDGVEKVKPENISALSQNVKPYQVLETKSGCGTSIIVAHGTTVRSYDWKDGGYHINRQYNPINEHAEAFLACSYSADGKHGIMVYDQNSQNLLWYPKGATEPNKIHIAAQNTSFEGMIQLRNKKRAVLMLVGSKGIALLTDKSRVLSLNELGEYMSKSEKPSLRFSRAIEISKPKRPAIAMVDANNRSIEIVSRHDNTIRHELTFPAFLKSDMVGPIQSHTTEPHDIASGDVNGNGYDDMILLVHDNLIIYPGE